jgi:hypothetical protein
MRARSPFLAALLAGAWLAAGPAAAQELVLNGGFEEYSICPGFLGQVDGHLDGWVRTGLGSTDYHNACGFNTRAARTGDGHLGLIPYDSSENYREFATGRLTAPLEAGQTYRLEFWVILSEGRLHAIQELSAWFTDYEPSFGGSGPPPGVVPQVVHSGGILSDKENWMRVSETFTAAGGEEFITLGNFYPDAETTTEFFGCCGQHGAYYHLDDVSLRLESSQPSVELSCAILGDRCPDDPVLDGDGRLDFGELLEVEITVTNTGSLDLTDWSGRLEVGGAEVEAPAGGLLGIASLPVGASETLPATLRIPLPEEGATCGQAVDLSVVEQTAAGGFGFPDATLPGCETTLDGCAECRPTCLHRGDVTGLRPHDPPRAEAYQARDPRDVALPGDPLACPFVDGDLEPDAGALSNGVALSLYQVNRPVGSLRLEKAGSTIRFRF